MDAKGAKKLLDAIEKQPSKRAGFLHLYGQEQLADSVMAALEAERDMRDNAKEKKQLAREAIEPWYRREVRKNGEHASTVVVAGEQGELQVQLGHRYNSLPTEKSADIKRLLGGSDFGRFFRVEKALSLKRSVAQDQEQLLEVVAALVEALGADRFMRYFEVKSNLAPTVEFTERRHIDLTPKVNAALEAEGVQQTLIFKAVR